MIRDPQIKSEIVKEWDGVRKLQQSFLTAHLLPGFGIINEVIPDEFHNLPFVLAFAVLDEVLTQLRDQGHFKCKSSLLGPKMRASRRRLPWQNYDLVNSGRKARNRLAHDARLLAKADCFKYIDAMEIELRAWGII